MCLTALGWAGCGDGAGSGSGEAPELEGGLELASLPDAVARWLEGGAPAGPLPDALKSGPITQGGEEWCGAEGLAALSIHPGAPRSLVHFHNVGDLDGDGHDDLVVVVHASHLWPGWSPRHDGRVFLFHGPITAERLPLSLEDADAELRLAVTRSAFGTLVLGSADLTGNGSRDLVLGTPLVDPVRGRGHASRWPAPPGLQERWRHGVVFVLEGGGERLEGVVDVASAAHTVIRGVSRHSGQRLVEPGLGGLGHALDGSGLGCAREGALALPLANSAEVLLLCGEVLDGLGTLDVDAELGLTPGMAVLRYPERHGSGAGVQFGFSRRAGLGHALLELGEDVVLSVPVASARGVRVRTELLVLRATTLAELLDAGAEFEVDGDDPGVRVIRYESTRRRVFTALHGLDDGRVLAGVDGILPGPSFVHALTLPPPGADVVGLHEVRESTWRLAWGQELLLGAGAPAVDGGLEGTVVVAARPIVDDEGRFATLVHRDQGGRGVLEPTDGAGVPVAARVPSDRCTGGVPLLGPGRGAAFDLPRATAEEPMA
ncbi:MAG: hypothetical protein EA398_17960, partial [Deltaproteobacteria bacterium]